MRIRSRGRGARRAATHSVRRPLGRTPQEPDHDQTFLTLLASAAALALSGAPFAAQAQSYPPPNQPPPDQQQAPDVDTQEDVDQDYPNPPQDRQQQDEQQDRDQQQQDAQTQQQYDQSQQQYQQDTADYQAKRGAYDDATADYQARQDRYQGQRLAYEDARHRYERARDAYDARWGAGAYVRLYGYGPDPYYYVHVEPGVRVERDPRFYWDGRWHDHTRRLVPRPQPAVLISAKN